MATTCEYTVEVDTGEDPDAAKLKARFERACADRLARLEGKKKPLPAAGDEFSILDTFEGKLVSEMSDAELEENPPTEVNFTVVSVEPAKRPPPPGKVRVALRLEY